MGQLIKLQDYVSRYEQNIYNYPSRFVRLKKQQWDKLVTQWEAGLISPPETLLETDSDLLFGVDFPEDKTMFTKVKDFLNFRRRNKPAHSSEQLSEGIEIDQGLAFSPQFTALPGDIDTLKQQFLDQLFGFQMRWASSTLLEKSVVQEKFHYDRLLKYFLQRFPDNILVLYKPIFLIKKAPVEADVIILTPTEVQCISLIEKEEDAVFIGSTNNFWEMRTPERTEKILNPVLAVNRMGNIVTEIFQQHEIDLPVRKIILSRNGYIDYPLPPYDVDFVEKRNYSDWFTKLRSTSSPLKHVQLKAANHLLQYCQTTSYRRLAWEKDETNVHTERNQTND